MVPNHPRYQLRYTRLYRVGNADAMTEVIIHQNHSDFKSKMRGERAPKMHFRHSIASFRAAISSAAVRIILSFVNPILGVKLTEKTNGVGNIACQHRWFVSYNEPI